MDINILWIMICTVGLTELAKVFCNKLINKWAALATVIVGVLVSCLYLFLPNAWDKLKIIFVAVSGATVFYNTIFKLFKKMIYKAGEVMYDSEGTIPSNTDKA